MPVASLLDRRVQRVADLERRPSAPKPAVRPNVRVETCFTKSACCARARDPYRPRAESVRSYCGGCHIRGCAERPERAFSCRRCFRAPFAARAQSRPAFDANARFYGDYCCHMSSRRDNATSAAAYPGSPRCRPVECLADKLHCRDCQPAPLSVRVPNAAAAELLRTVFSARRYAVTRRWSRVSHPGSARNCSGNVNIDSNLRRHIGRAAETQSRHGDRAMAQYAVQPVA